MVTTMMCAAVISHQMVLCWPQLLTTRGLLSGIHTLAQNCWNFGIYSFIICVNQVIFCVSSIIWNICPEKNWIFGTTAKVQRRLELSSMGWWLAFIQWSFELLKLPVVLD